MREPAWRRSRAPVQMRAMPAGPGTPDMPPPAGPRAPGQRLRFLFLCAALTLAILAASVVPAHEARDLRPDDIGVDEKLGATVPSGLSFLDQNGQQVALSRYLGGGPVLLSLNYYSCPTLCPLVFRNLVQTVGKIGGLKLGRDFRIVTVSIDSQETQERALDKASRTYAMLRDVPDPATAWPFLRGDHRSIDLLAQATGVRFARVGKNDFAHPNVMVVLTPQGRISRYLYGLELEPIDLRLALIEAADGRIGRSEILNRVLLYCFHYDAGGRRYVLLASRVMTAAMATVLALMLGLLALLWIREKKGKPGGGAAKGRAEGGKGPGGAA